MYANHPEMAKEWSEHTAKGTKLPEYVKSAMNAQEQAYLQGFVKRANKHGFNDNEAIELLKHAASARELALEHNKVNIPLQTLFSGAPYIFPLGMIHNGIKDVQGDKDLAKEKYLPSRFLRINGGSVLGSVAGSIIGGSTLGPLGFIGGGALGQLAGAGLGAKSYNDAIDELADKKKK